MRDIQYVTYYNYTLGTTYECATSLEVGDIIKITHDRLGEAYYIILNKSESDTSINVKDDRYGIFN